MALCGYCANAFISDILARRPDLRVLLETPGVAEERDPELDRDIQASIDQERFEAYLKDIRDGDDNAVVACSMLLKVAIPRGTLPNGAMKQLRDAIGEAAA